MTVSQLMEDLLVFRVTQHVSHVKCPTEIYAKPVMYPALTSSTMIQIKHAIRPAPLDLLEILHSLNVLIAPHLVLLVQAH